MKLITYADEQYKVVSDLTLPLLRRHCDRQQVEFKVYSEKVDPSLDVYWNRIPIIKQELPGSEFVIWSDADIYYAKDFNWRYYVNLQPDANIWVSSETKPDRQDICLGFAIYRECPWTFEFLDVWKWIGPMRESKVGIYCTWNRREQETFNILHDWFDRVHSKVARIPESIISNPISEESLKESSVGHHFWAASNRDGGAAYVSQRLARDNAQART
jgi:hypothetical protein